MKRLDRIKIEWKDAPESNDVTFLLQTIQAAKEALERIEQEAAASWIADIAKEALKSL